MKDVAIIGLDGKFPCANNPGELFELLRDGRNCVRQMSNSRIKNTGIPTEETYLVSGFIEDIHLFDYSFFGISLGEAQCMDPHQRMLLEVIYHAIENSGMSPAGLKGSRTSVFVSDCDQEYFKLAERFDPTLLTGNLNASVAGRVARFFDLRGNTMMVDTACSSVLVAIQLACNDLELGNSDMAIVCGVSLNIFGNTEQREKVGIMSDDGYSRSFSQDANGAGSGEMVGAVVLKPLDDALRDSDDIKAVLKGIAVNQNGGRASSFTAPHSIAHSEVLMSAWKAAKVDPRSVSYIEAHGSGTKLGDSIEISGINKAFSEFTSNKQFCAISSIKSNIGHTGNSAGMAGLIKVILSLRNKVLLPSIHFNEPSDLIDFISSPVYLNNQVREWKMSSSTDRRIAGLSSFGVTGTNAHAILAEPPVRPALTAPSGPYLIVVSSKTRTGLARTVKQLHEFLVKNEVSLADVSFSLCTGREHHEIKTSLLVTSIDDLKKQLGSYLTEGMPMKHSEAWVLLHHTITISHYDLDQFARRFPDVQGFINGFNKYLQKYCDDTRICNFIRHVILFKWLHRIGLQLHRTLSDDWGKLVKQVVKDELTLEESLQQLNGIKLDIFNSTKLDEFVASNRDKNVVILSPGMKNPVTRNVISSMSLEEFVLNITRIYYENGAEINWPPLFTNCYRVELPGYSFEPSPCWLTETQERKTDQSWWLQMNWVQKNLESKQQQISFRNCIVVGGFDNRELVFLEGFVTGIITTIKPGKEFRSIGVNEFEVDPGNEEHYRLVYQCMGGITDELDAVIFLNDFDIEPTRQQVTEATNSLYPQLLVCKTFERCLRDGFTILNVSANAVQVKTEMIIPQRAMGYALMKSILSDYPTVRVLSIDFEASDVLNKFDHSWQECVVENLSSDDTLCFVAYRKNVRYVNQIGPYLNNKANQLTLSDGATYVIVGGFGKIGKLLCHYIQKICQANIVVIGRSDFPATGDVESSVRVDYVKADITIEESVVRAFERIKQKYSRIDTIFNLAGISPRISLVNLTRREFDRWIEPKVVGSILIGKMMGIHSVSRSIYFSSIGSLIPDKDSIPYNCGCAFQDALAIEQRASGLDVTSVQWGIWATADDDAAVIESENDQRLIKTFRPSEALEQFANIDLYGRDNIIAGKFDFSGFQINPYFLVGNNEKHVETETLVYGDFQSESEKKLYEIWYEVLKKKQISPDENFFEMGGHSLIAIKMINKIFAVFQQRISFKNVFEYPSIRTLAQYLDNRYAVNDDVAITPASNVDGFYQTSHAQKRFWILHEFAQDKSAYNIFSAFISDQPVDVKILRESIAELVQLHELLRTIFVLQGDILYQRIVDDISMDKHLLVVNLAESTTTDELNAKLRQDAYNKFDLQLDPGFRVTLYTAGHRVGVSLVIHHINADRWSMEILFNDLLEIYSRRQVGLTSVRRRQAIQYKDFALWQNNQLDTPEFLAHRDYWLERLADLPPRVELPVDIHRPDNRSFEGDFEVISLTTQQTNRLAELGQALHCTQFAILYAITKLTLFKECGSTDMIIGTTISGRKMEQLERLVGPFINSLAIRARINPEQSIHNFMQRTNQEVTEAMDHDAYPFDKLVDDLNTERSPGHSLFDVMVLYHQNALQQSPPLKEEFSIVPSVRTIAIFDLMFEFGQIGNSVEGKIIFDTSVYRKDAITRLRDHMLNIIQHVCDNPLQSVSNLSCLSLARRNMIREFGMNNKTEPAEFLSLYQLFKRQVEEHPTNIAIRYNDTILTYLQIGEMVDRISGLINQASTGDGNGLMGVFCERSELAIASIFAILKCRFGYVPINHEFPRDRVDFLIKDANLKYLVTDRDFTVCNADLTVLNCKTLTTHHEMGTARTPRYLPDDVAYVIYTSGSTGFPKGVMVEQRSVINMINSLVKKLQITNEDRMLQFTSLSFDVHVFEIFASILSGATLVIVDDETIKDISAFCRYCEDQEVTIAMLTPLYLNLIPDHGLRSCRLIFTGGEKPILTDAKKWSRISIYNNGYGPTECSVFVSHAQFKNVTTDVPELSIGRPIDGVDVFIINKAGEVVDIDCEGEICVGGVGLARGYLNKPELTHESFRTMNIFGDRMVYRTGDIASWRYNGELVFKRRIDDQVKVRGFRVEPGEIAEAIKLMPDVFEAIVIPFEQTSGRTELVAFCKSNNVDLNAESVKGYLKETLPNYMVPTFVHLVTEFPMNSSNKIDKNALLQLLVESKTKQLLNEPKTTAEIEIASIWSAVLELDSIDTTVSFFDLGGNSIKLISLFHRMNSRYPGLKITDLFKYSTIDSLARHLEQWQTTDSDKSIEV